MEKPCTIYEKARRRNVTVQTSNASYTHWWQSLCQSGGAQVHVEKKL